MSAPYRISFCVVGSTGDSGKNLQVFVDNNTIDDDNSMHGTASLIYKDDVVNMPAGQRMVIDSSLGTATSFLFMRLKGQVTLTIDDLWVGLQSDTSSEPGAETCTAG